MDAQAIYSTITASLLVACYGYAWSVNNATTREVSKLRTERAGLVAEHRALIEKLINDNRHAVDMNVLTVQTDLMNFKLAVSNTYASFSHLREVEGRIMAQLEKMYTRLDKVGEELSRQRRFAGDE